MENSKRQGGETMSQSMRRLSEHLYRFDDTCNVYLLVDGDAGLLIDAGSGAVLDHLPRPASSGSSGCCTRTTTATSAGARRGCASTAPRWRCPSTSGTCSTRPSCSGRPAAPSTTTTTATPSSPSAQNIPVDAVLEDYETFTWRGYEFFVLPAKGHTLGSSALLADDRRPARGLHRRPAGRRRQALPAARDGVHLRLAWKG